jgi:hypothetical protein
MNIEKNPSSSDRFFFMDLYAGLLYTDFLHGQLMNIPASACIFKHIFL